MKKALFLLILICQPAFSELRAPWEFAPFADKAGSTNTTAIHKDNPVFSGWADWYTDVQYGTNIVDKWKTPQKALGKAVGDAFDIVCLGDGGQITLTFHRPIIDGEGFDFAVFENGYSSTYLELAWVEVSSDGTHFVRFPNYYMGTNKVSSSHSPTYIYGMASKYKAGYGTPFDLNELQEAYDQAIIEQPIFFTDDYTAQLTNNFPHLDLNNIGYVRLIDIVGDGSAIDTFGTIIYDPYPTSGSAGFDLDAIGVINRKAVTGDPQSITFPNIPHQKLSRGSVSLKATSDSGLPISYVILAGDGAIDGNILSFTNSGEIVVQALQAGNTTYAPADPIARAFHVAEKLQHIWIEPIPNQLTGFTPWQVQATASSGLPVYLEITSGPSSAFVNATTHSLYPGTTTGTALLHATQVGDETYAPAQEIYMEFDIVSAGASNAPQSFAEWNKSTPRLQPQIATNQYNEQVLQFTFTTDRQVLTRTQLQATTNLSSSWSNTVPEIVSTETTDNQTLINIQMPIDETNNFFRLLFEDPAE